MKYEEFVKRVREWLWHYTTLDTWGSLKFIDECYDSMPPEECALRIISGRFHS